jgi:hypothetical protein
MAYGITSERRSKLDQNVSLELTVAIGPLRIVVITSSIGTTMKTGVESVPATAPKISQDSGASRLESSNQKAYAV